MAQLKTTSSAEVIMAQYGTHDEEVTEAEAEAVLKELMAPGAARSGSSAALALKVRTKKAMECASGHVKAAVAYDSSGDTAQAIKSYESALTAYSECLQDPALSPATIGKIIPPIESYLDRCLILRQSGAVDYAADCGEGQKQVLRALASRGFSVLKRGVGLYKRVKGDASTTDWSAYVCFTEALACLEVYSESESSPVVDRCLTEMRLRHHALRSANGGAL